LHHHAAVALAELGVPPTGPTITTATSPSEVSSTPRLPSGRLPSPGWSLVWKHRKPLVLKSSTHIARIRLLLDLFPEAKFVHIRRNVYAVFQSAPHTTQKLVEYFTLQLPDLDIEGRTIRDYPGVYDAFVEQVAMIRRGRFHEIRYDDLQRDPIGQMRRVYEALRLPDFGEVEPALGRYVGTLSGYRKNPYPAIPPTARKRIADERWRCVEAWVILRDPQAAGEKSGVMLGSLGSLPRIGRWSLEAFISISAWVDRRHQRSPDLFQLARSIAVSYSMRSGCVVSERVVGDRPSRRSNNQKQRLTPASPRPDSATWGVTSTGRIQVP
jgi:hypothetical protein